MKSEKSRTASDDVARSGEGAQPIGADRQRTSTPAIRYGDIVKILVIEDDENDLELMTSAFRRQGIANPLVAAKDGAEGLDLLYQDSMAGGHGFSLIVLDLTLPRIDGREVLKRIWEDKRLRQIPVIVLSESRSDVDLINSYKTGAVAFLRKPINPLDFLGAIMKLSSYKIVIAKTDASDTPPRSSR